MTNQAPTRREVQLLMKEARRYLAAVDAFRAEGCEPAWLPERELAEAVMARVRGAAIALPPIP